MEKAMTVESSVARPTAWLLAALLATGADAQRAAPTERWTGSWGSAQMVATGDNALPADRAGAITLRQVVRLSAGGTQVRVRLSNAFGTQPLRIGAAQVARPVALGTARIAGGTTLRFAGQVTAVIPAGGEIYSDPIALALAPGADLAVSLYLPDPATPQTGHPGARATSFTVAGNHVADPLLAGATATPHWYALADVEVAGPRVAQVTGAARPTTIVTIGDSITDGYGVAPERNTRWPDILAERLRAAPATRTLGVVNAGIGGNRILLDGLGPNLVARFDRDVIARSGVGWAILLEGVNDLGVLTRDAPASPQDHAALVAQLTAGLRQLADRAHVHGIKIIGGTVMPFGGNDYYHPDAALEADRQAVNSFIRNSGVFDAVIDFDRVMRDPRRPDRLAPAFDSGDHLHPSEAGYRAMGAAVPLALFTTAQR
jgi:lysophospholipase L1-like esterase